MAHGITVYFCLFFCCFLIKRNLSHISKKRIVFFLLCFSFKYCLIFALTLAICVKRIFFRSNIIWLYISEPYWSLRKDKHQSYAAFCVSFNSDWLPAPACVILSTTQYLRWRFNLDLKPKYYIYSFQVSH